MNKRKKHHLIFLASLMVICLLPGCTGRKAENKSGAVKEMINPVVIGKETTMLLKDLEENGDYVNSEGFPSLIKASIVNDNLDKNILVIDMRPAELFAEGHIKNAVNKRFEELPSWFEAGIKPFKYDKIILVCEDGQVSSYTTSLLRLMGYGNVYAMRWGMSAWNMRYAQEGWLKGVSGKYESDLEKAITERPALKGMPELNTGKNTGEEIGAERFRKLFEEGTGKVFITADELFNDPKKYFVINLERKDKYEDGHVPGAIRYKPEGTLGFTDEMASIPSDKTVVVYCGTGHNSGFATAYLRLFGYDARTLKFGNNGFMHDKMIRQKAALSWLPFTSADVNDFE